MTNKSDIVRSYQYRVHTLGGHVHAVYVPYSTMADLWSHILEMSSLGKCLEAFTVAPNGNNFEVRILASSITVVDAPWGKTSLVLSELNGEIKAERTKNAVKKAAADKKKRDEVMNNRKSAKKRTL